RAARCRRVSCATGRMTVAIPLWQKTRRRAGRLARVADGSDAGLQREPLELLERQCQQQIDPTADQQERIPERRPLGHLVALDLGGVRHPPVRQHWLARKNRARFLGSIAYGDDEVPRLALQAVEATGSPPRPRD